MNEKNWEELIEEQLNSEPQPASSRGMILAIGGFFLLGLALALLLFGGSLFEPSREMEAAELPQIPTTASASDSRSGASAPPAVGDRAHEFVLPDLDGNSVALSDFRGRPVVVNFWATWCPPCRLEMPELQTAYEAHQEDDLVLLAVNEQEQEKQVRDFFDEMGFTFTPLMDKDGDVGLAYGALGLPSTYFIDAAGEVTAVHRGILTGELIENYLALTIPQ